MKMKYLIHDRMQKQYTQCVQNNPYTFEKSSSKNNHCNLYNINIGINVQY